MGLLFSVIGHVSDGGALKGKGIENSVPVENTASPLLFAPPRKSFPHIDKMASPNVTALLGKNAYLNCKVKNLGDKTVSTESSAFSSQLHFILEKL